MIEAVSLRTHSHDRPGLNGYAEIRLAAETDPLAPRFAPALALTLGRLDLA